MEELSPVRTVGFGRSQLLPLVRLVLVVDTGTGAGTDTDTAQMREASPLWEEQSMTGFPASYTEPLWTTKIV